MAKELELIPEDAKITVVASEAIGVIVKSEVEAQLDAAHKYPRSIKRFLGDAITLATFDTEVAMSCIYALPRGGKVISGPSVRLAEICASAYGNLHMGARVIGVDGNEIQAQGVCWDLEKNNRVTIEVRRRITDKHGRHYNDDMITMTGNAAASIGFRNAIFRVIPKAYVNSVYQKAREVAVGNASTLSAKRVLVMERLIKMGALQERILARAGKASVEDITIDDMELLIGLGTAIKDGTQSVDEAFPAKDQGKPATSLDAIVEKETKPKEAATPNPQQTTLTEQLEDSMKECDKDDFIELENIAHQSGVLLKEVSDHVKTMMGFETYGSLTKGRKAEVVKWIQARKKTK